MAEVRLDSMLSQFVARRSLTSPALTVGTLLDDLESAGVRIGTTTGQLFSSRDAGRNGNLRAYPIPGIHSVAAGTSHAR